jgi:hypothetical protein
VLEALLEKVLPGGFEIVEHIQWSQIHRLRPGTATHGEAESIRRLALRARELGCHALVFVRDRDGDRARERTIEVAIAEHEREKHPARTVIAGGVAVEKLEAWLLALDGVRGSEQEPDAAKALEQRGIPLKHTGRMVDLVHRRKLGNASEDAHSLWRWLRRSAVALNVRIPAPWPRPRGAR